MAGVMTSGKLYPFMYRGQITDVNNASETGYYLTTQSAANSPTFFPLIISFIQGGYGVQFAKELTISEGLYIRTKLNSAWGDWLSLPLST